MTQVPHHAIDARGLGPDDVPDLVAGLVADRDGHGVLFAGRVLEPVLNGRAIRGVRTVEDLVSVAGADVGDAPLDAGPVLEEVDRLCRDRLVHPGERRDVVENPDAAPVGPEDQVVFVRVNLDVIDRNRGQAALDLQPRSTPVEGSPQRHLRAHEENIRVLRVLADHAHRAILGQVRGHVLPRRSEVGREEDVGVEVIAAVAIEGHVGGAGAGAARLDAAHVGSLRHAGNLVGELRPGLAQVLGHVKVAVVRAEPEDLTLERRLRDGGGGVPVNHAVVAGHEFLRGLAEDRHLVALLVVGEVRGEFGPRVAAVLRHEELVAAIEDGVVVELRDYEGGVPVEAVLLLLIGGRGPYRHTLEGLQVEAGHIAVLTFDVDRGGIDRIDHAVEAVTAAHVLPVVHLDALPNHGARRPDPGLVVLQPAADVVRFLVVRADLVELAERDRVQVVPGLALVEALMDAAVGSGQDVVRVGGVNPKGVIVAMNSLNQVLSPRLSAVLRVVHVRGEDPDALVVVRVDVDLAVVRGARVGVRELYPGFAFVL